MNKSEKIFLSVLPVLAPAPTGYVVFAAFLEHGWFWPAALVTVLALEILGYFSARLIMSVGEHNRTLSATEKHFAVSPRRAWLPVVGYVTIALFMTFFVKMFPALFVWSLLAFPFIGLLSAWVTAEFRVLDDHANKKETARADAREAARRAKDEKKQAAAALAQVAEQVAQPTAEVAQPKRNPVADDELLLFVNSNPGVTNTQVAQRFGVSRQAVAKRLRKLYAPEQVTQ